MWPYVVCALGLLVYLYAIPSGVVLRDSLVYLVSLAFLSGEMYGAREWPASMSVPMVLSLTTSPKRLRLGLSKTLDIVFGYTNVRIILNIPELYRNEEAYPEDAIRLLQDRYADKLVVHRVKHDIGPQLKLIGTLDYLRSQQQSAFVVVIDDDVMYHKDLLLAYDCAVRRKAHVSVFGAKEEWIYGHCIHPGFASFGLWSYRMPERFHDDVTNAAGAHASCKRHDDFLFSSVFHAYGLSMDHVKIDGPLSLPIGFDTDALHTTELSVKKHFFCSRALWGLRAMCPASRVINTMFTYGPRV